MEPDGGGRMRNSDGASRMPRCKGVWFTPGPQLVHRHRAGSGASCPGGPVSVTESTRRTGADIEPPIVVS
jgi:hypothetical protein